MRVMQSRYSDADIRTQRSQHAGRRRAAHGGMVLGPYNGRATAGPRRAWSALSWVLCNWVKQSPISRRTAATDFPVALKKPQDAARFTRLMSTPKIGQLARDPYLLQVA